MIRSRVLTGAVALLVASASRSLRAQCPCPTAGRWGAEAMVGPGFTASLLKFRTADAAWVLGLSGDLARRHEESSPPGGPSISNNVTQGFATLTIGHRWYGPAAGALRPFTAVVVSGTYAGSYGENYSGSHTWAFGPALDMGASYYFSPHLSLGASGALGASYTHTSYDGIGSQSAASYDINLRLVRVLAAVYF